MSAEHCAIQKKLDDISSYVDMRELFKKNKYCFNSILKEKFIFRIDTLISMGLYIEQFREIREDISSLRLEYLEEQVPTVPNFFSAEISDSYEKKEKQTVTAESLKVNDAFIARIEREAKKYPARKRKPTPGKRLRRAEEQQIIKATCCVGKTAWASYTGGRCLSCWKKYKKENAVPRGKRK